MGKCQKIRLSNFQKLQQLAKGGGLDSTQQATFQQILSSFEILREQMALLSRIS